MRRLTTILAALALLPVLAAGCRCQSGTMQNPTPGAAGAAVAPGAVAQRWCRACALRSFLSCKRVDGTGTEEEIRRKAEEVACGDIGFTPAQCTKEKIRFAECGVATP